MFSRAVPAATLSLLSASLFAPLVPALLVLLACGEPLPPVPRKQMSNPPIRPGEFARAEGTHFMIGDGPFRFVGANTAMIHGDRAREGAADLFEALARDKVGVIRVWAAGEAVADGRAWHRAYAFRVGPEAWVETTYEHLDHLLAEARRWNIRVIVTLVNRWGDYGGLPQYARWIGLEPHRRHLLSAELSAVLSSDTARDLYRDHVERLVTRVNTVTGVSYRDDPTIFAWELANELSAQSCEADAALYDWTRTMARFIRGLDGAHLIAAGHIGYKTELSRESWRQVTALPEIGFADVHAYPQNVPGPVNSEGLGAWLDDRAHLALGVLGKPLVIGEIGFPRDDSRFVPRAEWFSAALDRADLDGVSGVMVWIYRSWDEHRDSHGIWAEGPLADESKPIRAVLRGTAARWAEAGPEVRSDAVRGAGPDARLYPMGLEHLRPWPEGEWSDAGPGATRLSIETSAFAEGCALGEGPAWLVYAADMGRTGAPEELVFEDLGSGPEDAAVDLGIDVIVDETHVGTWNGPGRFEARGEGALEVAFAGEDTTHWVRFESRVDAGRAHIGRMITAIPPGPTLEGTPPSPGMVTLRARWAAPPSP